MRQTKCRTDFKCREAGEKVQHNLGDDGFKTSNNTKAASGDSTKPRIRYHLLDELRGFAVFCMVFYHAFYTLCDLGVPYFESVLNFFMPAEPFFAGFFILLSGVCCRLSHSNLSRGLKLAAVAAAVTGVTYCATAFGIDDCVIWFGVLHLLSVGMLCCAVFDFALKRIPPGVGAVLFFLLFILSYNVEYGSISLGGHVLFELPQSLYKTNTLSFFWVFITTILPLPIIFRFLPWLFPFFVRNEPWHLRKTAAGFPLFIKRRYIPFFSVFLGRHALLIYILHQPVIFGITYAVAELVNLF